MPTSPPELRSITLIQLDIRDAQLVKGSERLLLDAIALRGNRKQHYICFPAYALLSRDTQVSVRQLKDSAQSLVKKGLIKMRVRPNQSNIYQVQFEYIHGQAEEKRAEAKRKKQEIASLNDLTEFGVEDQETAAEEDVPYPRDRSCMAEFVDNKDAREEVLYPVDDDGI